MKVRCLKTHGSTPCPDCANTYLVEDPSVVCGRYECFSCHGAGWYSSGCDGQVECEDCGCSGLTMRPQICYACSKSPACPDCEGSGKITRVRGNCEACKGMGVVDAAPCAPCGGKRWVPGDLRLYDCTYCGVVPSEPMDRKCPKCRHQLSRLLSGKILSREV